MYIIGVRFKRVGKIYYFDPGKFDIETGKHVIVETSRGVEMGEVVLSKREIDEKSFNQPLKRIIRPANKDDYNIYKENKKKEESAFGICIDKIKKHKLPMKLIEVEYTFDGNKIMFYFTADGRVDFRELVKDLANIFKTRIELRQIGVRDESKIMSGVGICGCQLCCSRFLGEFIPVSIKMAKEQGLSLNPSKISGSCGRLMCCLKYEQDTYEDALKKTPRQGAIVRTPAGQGSVEYVNVLKGIVRVKIDGDREKAYYEFNAKDIKIIKNGSRDDFDEKIDDEMLKKLEDD
ncbi:MAG: stage 0 sporulation family protein [Oscillospiraceae bacterium]|nr:stage 0 sporulation family protein [Oscillospiraceae bacterium]